MDSIKQTIDRLKSQSNETTQNDPTSEPSYKDYYSYMKRAMLHVWDEDPFKTTKELVVGDQLEDILINIGKYIAGEEGKYKPNLGFIIMGGVGTGKSLLLNALMMLVSRMADKDTNFYGEKVKWITARNLSTLFRRSDWDTIKSTESVKELFIDDVGTENPFLLVYGNKEYPISEMLYARHEKKRRTYFTTNLDWGGIKDLYDDQDGRIMDRIKSNSNVIILDGKSWR